MGELMKNDDWLLIVLSMTWFLIGIIVGWCIWG